MNRLGIALLSVGLAACDTTPEVQTRPLSYEPTHTAVARIGASETNNRDLRRDLANPQELEAARNLLRGRREQLEAGERAKKESENLLDRLEPKYNGISN